jgi:drug/metabolite transporter (DMT)-like permease
VHKSDSRFAAEGALVLAALLFGVTFPLVGNALDSIEPFAYLLIRFGVAVLALAPFAIVIARKHGEDRRLLARTGLVAGRSSRRRSPAASHRRGWSVASRSRRWVCSC